MKLGQIVAPGAGGFRAPTKEVTFKVIGRDHEGGQTVADAQAVLAFVPDDARQEALVASEKATQKVFAGATLSTDRLEDSHTYHLLALALRDRDDVRQPFAMGGAAELRSALHRNEASYLYLEYLRFVDDEFPQRVDEETFEELAEAASKKSLSDLLSSHGSSLIRRALPFLAAHFGKSPTPTSGGGGPG